MVEQVLMRTNDRSEAQLENASSSGPSSAGSDGGFKESSAMQKRFQRLSRNVSEAIASLKNSLSIDSVRESTGPPSNRVETCRKHVWGSVVRSLTQLYPGSQLPEKLVSNIRKHYDSLPLRFSFFLRFSKIFQESTLDPHLKRCLYLFLICFEIDCFFVC